MFLHLQIAVGKKSSLLLYTVFAVLVLSCITNTLQAQTVITKSKGKSSEFTGTASGFIHNIGQYGQTMKGYETMGNIVYGYEGLNMPVLFTPKGLIHLHRKSEKISHAEEELLEKQGVPENEIERKRNITDRVITMEWLHTNANVKIIAEEKEAAYHTYGLLTGKAYSYKKITYKNLYPGIDLVYSFIENDQPGFEYSLLVQPGADISVVKLKYGGDVKNITTDSKGKLIIRSDIDGISTTVPVSYYGNRLINKNTSEIKTGYTIENNQINFSFPNGYDSTKALIIDPFVSGTGTLGGPNAGKARDVDFDYAGNIYVTGGGSLTSPFYLAKYNATGALQWTFNGTLTIPSWSSNSYYGGWMVEKPTGHIYMGQGFIYPTGFRVIRVNTNGLYDNYITTANGSFTEAWKMFWSCNNGSPQILIAGGGINSNINFGVFAPPSTTVTSLNVTGIPYAGTSGGGWAQDIADFVFDAANNDMYSIYGSTYGTPSLNNKIYKNTAPYSAASIAWNVPSGFNTVREAANRPYLAATGLVDNSANMLWVNASYLYYWDGKNLKAFNKATGAAVGTPLVTTNTAFMQGGVIADACNNIFVGEGNGVIKVYNFNGATFSDAPADIPVPGFTGRGVYDLAYDESRKLLYASGDGFVASLDVTAYCPNTFYTINVAPNCVTKTATATITPTPPAGSTVTYNLYIGTTLITTNTTGIFTGLNPNITYTIVATINLACSGSQATTTFVIPGPTINTTQINTTCGASTGSITATGSGTAGPYTYSIDGVTFQPSGTFNGLAAGVYTVTVRDMNGCPNTTTVTILNTDGPALTFTQTNADCGNNTGTVTANATGGTPPYQYSITGGVTYQTGNFFTGLVAGQYTLVVRDANGCTNRAIVVITTSIAPTLSAVPSAATCNQANGMITAFGGGTAPLQFSIDGNTFQPGNVFNGLAPGTYTVYVKDATGCTKTVTVTVGNAAPPTVTATASPAVCGNTNGSITAAGSGGIAPYQFSINGGTTYQTSNVFTGLAPGTYTITIRDNTGCTNIVTVTVNSTGGPVASGVSTATSCGVSTGSITITGISGTAPYQYSINGITFFATNIFNGLAAGNYVVYVRDAGGCIGTGTVTVLASAGPLITAVSTPSSCAANTGTITATGTGGTPPLQYSINGTVYQASNIFNGLAPGIYTVYVRDVNGCTKTTTVTVGNASGLALSVATISASCGSNGTITATAMGGIAPLQYSINGTTYQAGNVFTGLAPGTYTVYVRDANNCILTKQAVVGSAAALSLTVNVSLQATCASSNGVIRATGSGGVAPLTYSINGTLYQSSGLFIGLAPGTYTVYVKDANGCIVTQTATITTSGVGPGISTFTADVTGAYPCNGGGGRIDGFRVNGNNCATCTYSFNFGPYLTAADPFWDNIAPGTYPVTAIDANGCTMTIMVTVGLAPLATATATVTPSSCSVNNGTITLIGVDGGGDPYHANINGGPFVTFAATYTFTNLAPGTYTIVIADDEDYNDPFTPGLCLTTITVVVPSTGGPSVATTQINPTCNSNNGSITATGSGGTAPYVYSINGGAFLASGVFNNLLPGTYIIRVRDNTNCINLTTVTLTGTAVPTVTAVVLAAACNTNNGTITATGTGGTAPLEYSINGTTYQASNIFTGLAPGAYTLYVKDANNCFSPLAVNIGNIPRAQVTAYTIAATCGNNDGSIVATGSSGTTPYTFSIDGTVFQSSGTFTGLAAGFYTVTIKDKRGCTNTTGVTVSNAGAPTIAAAVTSATCDNANGSITVTSTGGAAPLEYSKDGIVFQSANIFTGLLPGTYVITVKDANGCINTRSVLVGNINGPQTLTAAIVHAACGLSNGSITATASGGTGALQYSINGTTYQASNIFNGLAANSYILYVRDVNNCVKQLPVTINNLPAPALTATSSPASCGLSDGTITAVASGGTLPLQYSRNGITFQASNIFLNLAAGPYTITVRDARNCTATFTITVTTAGTTITPTFTPVAPICAGGALNALPTTSLNGVIGTWSPALNNTTTTTYTFTPNAGQCATTATLTITVNPNIIPTFTPVAPICAGGALSPLPTTSLNGITGTWSPALNNASTTTYTFTPTAGQCATTTTLTVTVNPNVIPAFTQVAAICSGGVLNPLPTTSLNSITGTWTPALNNTATTTYTFTPTTGQCATTATMTITINPIVSATINCGTSTTSSVTFNWATVTGATGYNVSYQINANAPVNVGAIGNVLTYPLTGLAGGDNVTITVTPTGGTGTCFAAASLTCIATACTPPAAAISYATPFCSLVTAPQNVSLTGTGAYTGGTFSSTAGLTINSTTGAITPNTSTPNIYTVTYTVAPVGGCPGVTATTSVTINAPVTPTFNPVAPICVGNILNPLPTTSLNGITGTWSPALNNTTTTTYTFTPAAGQCATTITLTIIVNPKPAPIIIYHN